MADEISEGKALVEARRQFLAEQIAVISADFDITLPKEPVDEISVASMMGAVQRFNSERRAYLQLVFTQQLQRDFLLSLQTADEQSARPDVPIDVHSLSVDPSSLADAFPEEWPIEQHAEPAARQRYAELRGQAFMLATGIQSLQAKLDRLDEAAALLSAVKPDALAAARNVPGTAFAGEYARMQTLAKEVKEKVARKAAPLKRLRAQAKVDDRSARPGTIDAVLKSLFEADA